MGLVHPTVEQGDEVVILFGCSVPVVLSRNEGLYCFKGDAYIHGCMNGEILESTPERDAGYWRIKEMSLEWRERWFKGLESEPADGHPGDGSAAQVFKII